MRALTLLRTCPNRLFKPGLHADSCGQCPHYFADIYFSGLGSADIGFQSADICFSGLGSPDIGFADIGF